MAARKIEGLVSMSKGNWPAKVEKRDGFQAFIERFEPLDASVSRRVVHRTGAYATDRGPHTTVVRSHSPNGRRINPTPD